MASKPGIHIHGLMEFQQAIGTLIRQAETVLLRTSGELAATKTIEAAKSIIPVITGAAANSLVILVEKSSAIIQGGGPGVPYYGWLEFGGESGIGGSNVREYVPEGRYVYPAFESQKAFIEYEINQNFRHLVQSSGLDVR